MSDNSLIKTLQGISFLHDIDPASLATDCEHRRDCECMIPMTSVSRR